MLAATEKIKAFRAAPVLNRPVTSAIRRLARGVGVSPEFAIKHLPHSGVTSVHLPSGRARFWSRGDDWVSNQVFWRGWNGYEPEVSGVFWWLALNARLTIDIGAHVGYYSVLAATASRDGIVYAVEALPAVFERLQRNLALNRLDHVIAVPVAAGNLNGTADFYHLPGRIPSSSSLSETFMQDAAGTTSTAVTVVSVDALIDPERWSLVDLVKIDTETTEPDVLAGMTGILGASAPDIVCEVLPTADVRALTSVLEPFGYEFFLLTSAGLVRRARIEPSAMWHNYLFRACRPPRE